MLDGVRVLVEIQSSLLPQCYRCDRRTTVDADGDVDMSQDGLPVDVSSLTGSELRWRARELLASVLRCDAAGLVLDLPMLRKLDYPTLKRARKLWVAGERADWTQMLHRQAVDNYGNLESASSPSATARWLAASTSSRRRRTPASLR